MASFDENGKYIKTNWKAGDKITSTKLNKIEESIEAVNDNDISRHVEADARLDALEAKDATHDKELTKIKNDIADNKAAAELGDYEINSRMTFLENELNEGIEEVHNVAETMDNKIATAETNMNNKIATAETNMNNKIAAAETNMDDKIATAETNMDNKIATAETNMNNKIATAETNMNNKIAAAETNMDDKIATAETNMNDKIATAETDMASAVAQGKADMASAVTQGKADMASAVAEVDAIAETVDAKIAKAETDMASAVAEVDAIAETVDAKIAEADASLNDQVNTAKNDINVMLSAVQSNLDELYAKDIEQDEELANSVKSVNGVTPNENGNVTISATLEAPPVVASIEQMTDTNKSYVLSTDGHIYSYEKLPPTIDTTWSDVLAKTGYTSGYRVNSSGEVVSYTAKPTAVTGYIPCKPGDEFILENFTISDTYVSGTYSQHISLYTTDKTFIRTISLTTNNLEGLSITSANGYVTGFTLNADFVGTDVAYIIISSQTITTDSKVLMQCVAEEIPLFTNLANTDGTDWIIGQRLSTISQSAESRTNITNAISAKNGDTVYFKNVSITTPLSSSMRFAMYMDGTRVNAIEGTSPYYGAQNGYVVTDEDGVTTCKLVHQLTGETFTGEFNSVRFTVDAGSPIDNAIITVNEPIKYKSSTSETPEDEYAWRDTGISFLPSDYTEDLIEINNDMMNLKMAVKDLEKKVNDAEDTSDGNPSIPKYWVQELEDKAEIIRQVMETVGRNKSAFLWYTDAHWQHNAKKSPLLLDYLFRYTPINKVNFGGDIVGDPSPYNHDNIKMFHDWGRAISSIPNHHSVYGNHDLNHWSTDVHNMAYALVLAREESDNMVASDIDGCYYIDNPSEKTRYLYLSYLTSNQADMLAQGQFICDAIKSVQEGWHIVAIAHRWFQYSSSKQPTVGSVPGFEADILAMFDRYNAREKMTSGTNYFSMQDFTDCKGKVEFCIGGHIHADYNFTSNGGIPVIITTSDANQERHQGDDDCGVSGTITEQAVYAVIADYAGGKINVIGIGRGESREVSLN